MANLKTYEIVMNTDCCYFITYVACCVQGDLLIKFLFRAYYFTVEELGHLFREAGFEESSTSYVSRQTVNKKEGVNAERIFIQGKFTKPTD